MVQGVNLEEIKKYNNSLKQYKDKAASLNTEIEYINKELTTLCTELTQELGVEVTLDNIEQIYEEQVSKINSTLQSGNAVLSKIQSEEQNQANMSMQSTVSNSSVAPVTQAQVTQIPETPQVQAPVTPSAPQVQAAVTEQSPAPAYPPIFGQQSTPGAVFNGQAATTELPTFFNIGQ